MEAHCSIGFHSLTDTIYGLASNYGLIPIHGRSEGRPNAVIKVGMLLTKNLSFSNVIVNEGVVPIDKKLVSHRRTVV